MIRVISAQDTALITKIHREALAGDFLPSLGFRFLKTFYDGVVNTPGVFGFVFEDDSKIQGFIIGTTDSKKFFLQAVTTNFIKLSLFILIQLVKKPTIIKNVMETLLYPKKDTGPNAELVVIALNNKYQGKGIGGKLVLALEEEFKKEGIVSYKVTVHADKIAVGFYKHLGYSRFSSFRLYDKMWHVYEKDISEGKRKVSR